jgi:hypothetical protein
LREGVLFPQKLGYGFSAGADLKFFVDTANIGVDGLVTDAKFLGDLLVEKALAEAIEDFLFALGEIFSGLWRRTGLLKGLGDFAGDVGGHGRTAAMNFVNGFEQFGGFRALEKVSVRAGSQGAEDIFGIFINCEHDDLEFGNELFQLANALDAIDAGEIDVHKDDFRTVFGKLLDCFFGRAVMAEASETVGAIQHARKRVSQLFVVFDDGDGYGHDEGEVLLGDWLASNWFGGGGTKSEARSFGQVRRV